MNRRNFVRAGLLGGAVSAVMPSAVFAGITKSALDSELAGAFFYTKSKPGRWVDKASGHAPLVESEGGLILVTTPHEMKDTEHYIVKHVIFDGSMKVLGEKLFNPKIDSAAISQYQIKDYKGVAYALSMCNQHDCWVTRFAI